MTDTDLSAEQNEQPKTQIDLASHFTKLEPTSMNSISAKLFTHLERVIVEKYQDEGVQLLKKALEDFGLKDAEIIARDATVEGVPHSIYRYLPQHVDGIAQHQDLNCYHRFTKFFTSIAKRLIDMYGEDAKNVIRSGVRNFGLERGAYIAQRVRATGREPRMEFYLDEYDFGRSDLFEAETTYFAEYIEQKFTRCPLALAWAEEGHAEYGILYCDTVDQAVSYGYSHHFECIHDQFALKDEYCHFLFNWKKGNE